MVGFKSFADETVVQPEDGITAIVGPNGCGKSNIVDAVRWVLGEKSGRALRGKSMEDVIFLGAETRKAAGLAEVEIIFDNADRSLPMDLNEVSIGRRIYPGSPSEYILNGRRVTRKEVDSLLMDTGIGKTAYSIMEQGRMSEILKASPEERRALFDEAAGISRFKAEKAETEKKLEDTRQNMLRLHDILREKEKELSHLDKQARKTREYLKLKEYLDERDLNLRYLKHVDLKEKEQKAAEKLRELLEKKNQIFEQITAREQEAEELEKRNQADLESMQGLDREYHQSLGQIESLVQRLTELDAHIDDRKGKLEQIRERTKGERKFHTSIEKKLQESMQLVLDLGLEIESMQGAIDKVTKEIGGFEEQVRSTLVREEEIIKQIEGLDADQHTLLEELRSITADLIESIENRRKDLREGDEKRRRLGESIRKKLQSKNSVASEILADFDEYQRIEGEFRDLFFGETGLLSRKDAIDRRMNELAGKREGLQGEIRGLNEKRRELMTLIDREKQRRMEMELSLREFRARKNSSAEARDSIRSQIDSSLERLKYLGEEEADAIRQIQSLEEQKAKLREDAKNLKKQSAELNKNLLGMQKSVTKLRDQILELRRLAGRERESIEKLLPEISSRERAEENIRVALMSLEEELYNDYQMSPGDLAARCEKKRLRFEDEDGEYRRIKAEIQALGQFNALAIEEFERSKVAMEELLKQKKDIEDSERNIREIIGKIDDKSKAIFLDVFDRIQNNFVGVFQSLFGGGKATLTLAEPENPLSCGIQIMVQPPGKKNSSLSLLSGGEQNMTAIALMFATYLVRPSPFCLLDEIDAPLDDQNVQRFLKMLSGFASRSQFLVITHNKLTMSRSNAIFGVTQEEAGVSRLVSVRMDDRREDRAAL